MLVPILVVFAFFVVIPRSIYGRLLALFAAPCLLVASLALPLLIPVSIDLKVEKGV